MAKLSNMLVMINLLKSGRKYSVKELAERLEVSERVVREYKLFLEEAGIYLETIRGPYGGYVLNRDVVIPNLKYSQRDIDLIDACISKIRENQLTEELKGLKDKINYSIIDNQNKNEKYLLMMKLLKNIIYLVKPLNITKKLK